MAYGKCLPALHDGPGKRSTQSANHNAEARRRHGVGPTLGPPPCAPWSARISNTPSVGEQVCRETETVSQATHLWTTARGAALGCFRRGKASASSNHLLFRDYSSSSLLWEQNAGCSKHLAQAKFQGDRPLSTYPLHAAADRAGRALGQRRLRRTTEGGLSHGPRRFSRPTSRQPPGRDWEARPPTGLTRSNSRSWLARPGAPCNRRPRPAR